MIPDRDWPWGYEFERFDLEDLYEQMRTLATRIDGGQVQPTEEERRGLAKAARLLARVCDHGPDPDASR